MSIRTLSSRLLANINGRIRWCYWACLLAIAVPLNVQASALPDSVVMANSHSWAPMSYLDEAGQPSGLLIDFWKLYSEHNNQNVEFLLLNWGESLEAVKTGAAHVHAGLLESPERRRFFVFSKPMFPLVTGLFVRKDFDGIDQLQNVLVAVIKQSYEAEYMDRTFKDLNMIYYDNNRNMIEAVIQGGADAFVADFPTGMYFINKLDAKDDLKFARFLYSKPIHAAVRLDQSAVIDVINDGIDNIPPKLVKRLIDKWQPVASGNSESRSTYLLWLSLVIGLSLILAYYFLVIR